MEDEVKEKLVQYQQIEEQLKQFNNFFQELNEKSAEINGVIQALEELKNTPTDKRILVPIASGIFIKGVLKDNREVVLNVGEGVCVKKSIDETKKLLGKRLRNVEAHKAEVARIIQQLNEVETQLEEELEKYV